MYANTMSQMLLTVQQKRLLYSTAWDCSQTLFNLLVGDGLTVPISEMSFNIHCIAKNYSIHAMTMSVQDGQGILN